MYLRNLRAGSILVGAAAEADPGRPDAPEAACRSDTRASRDSDGMVCTNAVCDMASAARFCPATVDVFVGFEALLGIGKPEGVVADGGCVRRYSSRRALALSLFSSYSATISISATDFSINCRILCCKLIEVSVPVPGSIGVVASRLTMRLSCSGVGGGFAAADVALVDLLGGVDGRPMSAIFRVCGLNRSIVVLGWFGVQSRFTRLSKCGARSRQ